MTTPKGLLHEARAFRLRRGLERAARIVSPFSGSTQRDVADLVPGVGEPPPA